MSAELMHIYFCGIDTLSSFQVAELYYKVITKCSNAPLYTDFKKDEQVEGNWKYIFFFNRLNII